MQLDTCLQGNSACSCRDEYWAAVDVGIVCDQEPDAGILDLLETTCNNDADTSPVTKFAAACTACSDATAISLASVCYEKLKQGCNAASAAPQIAGATTPSANPVCAACVPRSGTCLTTLATACGDCKLADLPAALSHITKSGALQ